MGEITQRKDALRREIISNRKLRSSKNTVQFTNNLLSLISELKPLRVMVFESFGSEPETNDFIQKVGLPVIVPKTHQNHLSFELLQTGEKTHIQPQDLLLIPALAIDVHGNRLGRGKGYFDKALADIPDHVQVYAVIYDQEFLQEVPHEQHDRKVNGVVTELAIHKIN